MGNEVLVGYHGSTSANCKEIRKFGFKPSNTGWLGFGVYCFEDDRSFATKWARYKYSNGKVDAITCKISVSSDVFLDISDPRTEQSKAVNRFIEKLLINGNERKLGIELDFTKIDNNDLDGRILDIICRKDGYKVVRNFTHTRTDNDRKCKRFNSNICNGSELCVKDLNCLSII